MSGYYIYNKGRLNGIYGGRGSNFGGCIGCGGFGWSASDVWNALLPQKAAAEEVLGRPLTMEDATAAAAKLTEGDPISAGTAAWDTAVDATTKLAVLAKNAVVAQVEEKAKGGTIGVLVVAAAVVGLGYAFLVKGKKSKKR